MTKQEKNEVIEVLKGKFSQYNNFYITNTESLSVAQVNKLRGICFNKNVEMRVAKNTLIRKALEQLDESRFKGAFDALNGVTALMFSESAKEPAMILSSFRKEGNTDKPVLKAAFIDGDVFVGDNQLAALRALKSKNDLIGDIISALNAGGRLANLLKALEERGEKTETAEVAAEN
jgi:large subunit ribosomal protein L10